ncbi:hypothetical protein [Butyrivibrio sp. INlla14]|uniref:hypothetical protein n=1 Tax=Butyrivibrio sp. INlla14 TaxID=1520808 RepID=UPI000AE7D395|nr:hypothetical protein [Butyrivibrio sp. INlla14]
MGEYDEKEFNKNSSRFRNCFYCWQLGRLKDNPNSNKKMGDIWKEQEEAQKKTNLKLKRLRNSGTMNTEPIITMILMEVTDL